VSDQKTLGQLYLQIGIESQRPLRSQAVETGAAQDTARDVLKELRVRERSLSSTD
jgi:hypothetical protein